MTIILRVHLSYYCAHAVGATGIPTAANVPNRSRSRTCTSYDNNDGA